ncbi:hypothetical protein WKI68_02400 [Streptomyces sp. MS1.HAVA.3]|uniref:Uncharacterized protein n=1 Tax=Streptomyces caledonius TaxID=3134107 RepID=A0ABU8U036_9ACTN
MTLTNNSGKLLARDGSWLHWGVWSDGLLPPSMVQPGITAKWASESEGVMTGTEGSVTYSMAGESNKVTVYWNNPYVGGNGYSCSVPSGYTCSRSGGGETTPRPPSPCRSPDAPPPAVTGDRHRRGGHAFPGPCRTMPSGFRQGPPQ